MPNFHRTALRLLLGRRLPVTNGTIRLAGPGDTVTVRRDRSGVPYINAVNEIDAAFGLGFCQGQDRCFQIELLSRAARGTLAELVGGELLSLDRLSRRIGFHRSAQEQMQVLDEGVLAVLEAFASGVTAGHTVGLRKKPHEFALLRAEPSAFTAVDVVAIIKVQSFGMPSNWDVELARLKIIMEDGPEALRDLDPAYPEWHPVAVPVGAMTGATVDRLAEDIARFVGTVGLGGASNNWAVSGSRSATGRPLLANDPHLQPILPPHWYLAHVRTPSWAVAGAAFAGSPAIAAGHNGICAWGVTAGLLDNTDLFIEELGPDGKSIRDGDGFAPCEVRREIIRVKGGGDVVEDVLVTPRGPIISSDFQGQPGAVSIRGVWLDPHPINGFLGVAGAKNFEEFRAPFADWPLMPLNVVYADTEGTIGYQLVGGTPRRIKGYGIVPAAGWDPESGWKEGLVGINDMPHKMDPETGFMATANTQPQLEGEGPFLGVDWIDGFRMSRIVQVLGSRDGWDRASMAELQMDVRSVPWEELKERVLSAPPINEEATEALAILKEWDGQVGLESTGATLFEFFLTEMSRRVVMAKAPRSAEWVLGKGFHSLFSTTFFASREVGRLSRLMREQPDDWFDRTWPEETADALWTAYGAMRLKLGTDPAGWRWGHERKLTLAHPFGAKSLLRKIFNIGPFPWPGDVNTISQAGTLGSDPIGQPSVIASLRMVLDVGNWDDSMFSLPGGQSGNPLSPHYDDLLPYWKRGEGVSIAWSTEAVESATVDTLRLEPE